MVEAIINTRDILLTTFFKITLDAPTNTRQTVTGSATTEMRVHGLEVVRHLQTIDPSFLSMTAFTWLRDRL
jgi:hypothetical protein